MIASVDHIISLAERYGSALSVPASTVSSRVFDDSKKLTAIRDAGADLTLTRYSGALRWFSENWPADLAWPDDVPRPAPVSEAAQ